MTCEHDLALAQGEIERLTEENGDLVRDLKKKLRREQQLQHQLADALGETEAAQHGERVLARYNARFSRRLRWIPDGQNARIIKRAIRCFDSPEEGVQACLEAIDGLACKPYVVKDGQGIRRASSGTERQRYDDLHHCLGGSARDQVDEQSIARFRGYAQEAREASEGVPKWGPMVAEHYLDEAIREVVALRRTVEILRGFAVLESHYVEMLEQRAGVRLQDTLELAA